MSSQFFSLFRVLFFLGMLFMTAMELYADNYAEPMETYTSATCNLSLR